MTSSVLTILAGTGGSLSETKPVSYHCHIHLHIHLSDVTFPHLYSLWKEHHLRSTELVSVNNSATLTHLLNTPAVHAELISTYSSTCNAWRASTFYILLQWGKQILNIPWSTLYFCSTLVNWITSLEACVLFEILCVDFTMASKVLVFLVFIFICSQKEQLQKQQQQHQLISNGKSPERSESPNSTSTATSAGTVTPPSGKVIFWIDMHTSNWIQKPQEPIFCHICIYKPRAYILPVVCTWRKAWKWTSCVL